jgi:hypothetical protein
MPHAVVRALTMVRGVGSPVFDGIFDFCSIYTGASLEGAVKLNNNVRGEPWRRPTVARLAEPPLLPFPLPPSSARFVYSNVTLPSIGPVGYTTPRSSKPRASATSTTLSLPSWSSSSKRAGLG